MVRAWDAAEGGAVRRRSSPPGVPAFSFPSKQDFDGSPSPVRRRSAPGAGIEMGAGVAAGPHCPSPKDGPVRACLISPGRNRLRLDDQGSPARFRPRPFGLGRFLRVRPDYLYSGQFPASCLRAACAALRLPGRSSFPSLAASSGPPRVPSPAPCGRRRFPLRVPTRGPKASYRFPRNASSRFDPPFGNPPGRRSKPKLRRIGLSRFRCPGGSGSAGRHLESGFGFRFRVGLALLPSARPAFASIASPLRVRLSRFRRSRSARFVSEEPRPGTSESCHASPSRPSGFSLWITGISGITWIKRGTVARLSGTGLKRRRRRPLWRLPGRRGRCRCDGHGRPWPPRPRLSAGSVP